jgi:hypothetical protein
MNHPQVDNGVIKLLFLPALVSKLLEKQQNYTVKNYLFPK